MGTGYFPRVKSGQCVTLTPHPFLVLWSRKSRAIPLLPLWVIRPVQSLSACTRVHFTFFTLPRTEVCFIWRQKRWTPYLYILECQLRINNYRHWSGQICLPPVFFCKPNFILYFSCVCALWSSHSQEVLSIMRTNLHTSHNVRKLTPNTLVIPSHCWGGKEGGWTIKADVTFPGSLPRP